MHMSADDQRYLIGEYLRQLGGTEAGGMIALQAKYLNDPAFHALANLCAKRETMLMTELVNRPVLTDLPRFNFEDAERPPNIVNLDTYATPGVIDRPRITDARLVEDESPDDGPADPNLQPAGDQS
jgi:hypothetical protein